MKLIVGLGNPGQKYEKTRHNIGFLVIDALVRRWNAQGPQIKYKAQVYSANQEGPLLLIKPQTYMNLSGQAIAPWMDFYQCEPQDLIVIHDELDLQPMSLRIKKGGGTGGHNGLKSIEEHLGKKRLGYYRIRLGIGHPRDYGHMDPSQWVLSSFTRPELGRLEDFCEEACNAIELVIKGKALEAMNRFHQKEGK